jgi:hypothetical protein
MTLETADVDREVYVLNTNENSVSTAKSQFADEYDLPYNEVKGSKIHGTGNGRPRQYTRTSGDTCLVVCVHAP